MTKPKKFYIFPKEDGWMPYMWLLFLLIPMYNLLFYEGIWLKVGLAGLLLIFLVAYRNTWTDADHFWPWLVIEVVIAALFNVIMGGPYLFLYPAFALGFNRLDKQKFMIGMLLIDSVLISLYIGTTIYYWDYTTFHMYLPMNTIYLLIVLVAPFGGQSINRMEDLRKQSYESGKRLESAIKQEERQRISRDLHDTLGQSFSVMTIKSELARKLVEKDQERAKEEMKDVEVLSRETLASVRQIITAMRQIQISEELASISQALTSSKILFFTAGEELLEEFSYIKQGCISYCLRESVTNIIRHSKAKNCWIKIEKDAEMIIFTVKDDGRSKSPLHKGNGMLGMEERLKEVQGEITWQQTRGVEVCIRVPKEELIER